MKLKFILAIVFGILLLAGVTALTVGQIINANTFRNYNLDNYGFELTSNFTKTDTDLVWNVKGFTAEKNIVNGVWDGSIKIVEYTRGYSYSIKMYKECRAGNSTINCQNQIKQIIRDVAIRDREDERTRLKMLQEESQGLLNDARNEWTSGDLGGLN
jgi:hypothetical protein